MPGPPPNPHAVRRNRRAAGIRLPAGGRRGRTPKWPLRDNPRLTAAVLVEAAIVEDLEERAELDVHGLNGADTRRLNSARRRLAVAEETLRVVQEVEATIWRDLWRTPQAAEWERLRWTRDVAQYTRWKALAEVGNREAGTESRHYADALGLTPKSMRNLMWFIAPDELEEAKLNQQADQTARKRRSYLKAVDSSTPLESPGT